MLASHVRMLHCDVKEKLGWMFFIPKETITEASGRYYTKR
jgi:hypothetical protein